MNTELVLTAVLCFTVGMYCIDTRGSYEGMAARCCGVALLVTVAFIQGMTEAKAHLPALWLVGLIVLSAMISVFLGLGAVVRKRVLSRK